MLRVIVKGPDGQTEHTLALDAPHAVLVGRAPDPSAAQLTGIEHLRVEPAAVVARSVSANHAVVWPEAGGIAVRDLGSRNGTWLLVPRGHTVRVDASEVVLHLARAAGDAAGGDEPRAPTWRSRREYAGALAASIEEWMRAKGIEVNVAILARRDGEPTGLPTRLPLATGEALDVVPVATADATWSRLLERTWRWVVAQNALYKAEEDARDEGMILASRAIRAAHREVVEASQTAASTLLLTGASGAGKEMLAEVFHRHSGRSGPFIAVNCSMFSKDLLRSELFGAEAGSFTGATRRIIGAVERAHGGTLFLDEIGDMPLEVQPMLLRFLDRREFEPIGQYGRAQRADVRVVTATNRDLRSAARAGAFRVDLWYRLSVHVVEVPPLRARWDDVLAYLDGVRGGSAGTSLREALSDGALDLLRAHTWEGNFRELTNFAQRLPRGAERGSIDVATCRRALERGALHPLGSSIPPAMQAVSAQPDWGALVARAVAAFVEDHAREPRSWDDQKEWNEKYLKPLLFFHLSGAAADPSPRDETALSSLASQTATRVQADRGTAMKQLARYFERFRT